MSTQTAKNKTPNGSAAANGNGLKINSNIRVSAEYSNDMRSALRDEQKTILNLEIEEAVAHDVYGYVEFARTVLDTRTTPEKVLEIHLKTAFGNDKYYQDWKKKNPAFFERLIEQTKNADKTQPGASFAPNASGNGNGMNGNGNGNQPDNDSSLESDEDEALLENLKEVKTV